MLDSSFLSKSEEELDERLLLLEVWECSCSGVSAVEGTELMLTCWVVSPLSLDVCMRGDEESVLEGGWEDVEMDGPAGLTRS